LCLQFYIISITVVGLIVPYTSPALISRNSVDSKASPFIIAIKDAGISGLDSVMNAVVMMAVLSVANSSMYGATRTLAALAEQGQAPRILAYVDRKGRPLFSIGVACLFGLLSYLYVSPVQGPAFTWLLALSGLSSIFTWSSICYAHIQFRKAWLQQGNLLSDLIYKSPLGATGSWLGLIAFILILAAQICKQHWVFVHVPPIILSFISCTPFYSTRSPKREIKLQNLLDWDNTDSPMLTGVAISPSGGAASTVGGQAADFLEACLAFPVVMLSFVIYKFWYRTKWVTVRDIDLRTGRNECESDLIRQRWKEDRSLWPGWKKVYKTLC
jgi:amino acid transporter